MLNKDYREMLQYLSDEGVRFLLVGAYALAAHGFPRATRDIDFFVWANPRLANAKQHSHRQHSSAHPASATSDK